MRKTSLLLLLCLSAIGLYGQTDVSASSNPPIVGITWAKGFNSGVLPPARRITKHDLSRRQDHDDRQRRRDLLGHELGHVTAATR